MYNILKNHITHSKYDLPQVLERIKALYGRMEIDDAQREELEALAREKADFKSGLNTAEKLLELENRIRVLESYHNGSAAEDETVPEYQPGKWYYMGDKVLFEGAVHECTAPLGVVCVWSPAEYPGYWQKM